MVAPASRVQIDDLSARQLTALRRKADALGLSVPQYLKQLIQDDLAFDRKARNSSFSDLAAPFRKALKDTDESTLDRIVDRARRTPARRRK